MGSYLSNDIQEAVSAFENGGLVAMPTETVYGLAAPIGNLELVKKIFSFKERPFFDPLIVHVHSIEQARQCCRHWPAMAQDLADSFWPGPMTLVLEKSEKINDLITSGLSTVGIRMPNHPVALKLIEACGGPLAAPSANKFTRTSPTQQEHVLENFSNEDVCVLSSPPSSGGIESTIIRLNEKKSVLEILRPGLITKEDLKPLLEKHHYQLRLAANAFEKAVEAPGQFAIHYSPKHPLSVFEEGESLPKDFLVLALNQDPYVSARELYMLMQKKLPVGYKGLAFILPKSRKNLSPKEIELWESIENRLEKAATK